MTRPTSRHVTKRAIIRWAAMTITLIGIGLRTLFPGSYPGAILTAAGLGVILADVIT